MNYQMSLILEALTIDYQVLDTDSMEYFLSLLFVLLVINEEKLKYTLRKPLWLFKPWFIEMKI